MFQEDWLDYEYKHMPMMPMMPSELQEKEENNMRQDIMMEPYEQVPGINVTQPMMQGYPSAPIPYGQTAMMPYTSGTGVPYTLGTGAAYPQATPAGMEMPYMQMPGAGMTQTTPTQVPYTPMGTGVTSMQGITPYTPATTPYTPAPIPASPAQQPYVTAPFGTTATPYAGLPVTPPMGSPVTPFVSAPTTIVPPDFEYEPGAPVQQDINYTQGYLRTKIGAKVKVEFLIGTNMLIDREGTLVDVGISYIVIQETETDDLLLCDIYSIKFVKFLL